MARGTTLREAVDVGRCGSVSKVRVVEAITGLGRVETIGERCRLAGNIPVGRNLGTLAGLPPGNFLVSCLLRTEKVTSGCYLLDISNNTVMLELYKCSKPSLCISYMSPVSTHVDRACQIRVFPFLPSFRFRFPFHLTCIVYPALCLLPMLPYTRQLDSWSCYTSRTLLAYEKKEKKHDPGIIA